MSDPFSTAPAWSADGGIASAVSAWEAVTTTPLAANPTFDPATGEVLDIVDAEVVEDDPPAAVQAGQVPAHLARAGAWAVDLLRSPELVQTLSHDLRARLRHELDQRAQEARQARPGGRVVPATLTGELALLADAETTLAAIGAAFTDTARQARAMAGEVLADLPPDPGRGEASTRSVKVGTPGGQVKVTRTQPTKASVRDDEVVDVLVASLLAGLGTEPLTAPTGPARFHAEGARAALEGLRSLVGPLAWKTTALDRMVTDLEGRELFALAIRLGHAYGRVDHGNPTVKIEREGQP